MASPVSIWVAVTSTPGSRAPVASSVWPTTVADVWAQSHGWHQHRSKQDHDNDANETPRSLLCPVADVF